jgi:hypothetical protein
MSTRGTNMGMRIDEVRSRAQTVREGSALTLHDAYAAIDVPATEGAAAFGDPFQLQAYDVMQLLLDYTAGTATTGVQIVAQVSPHRNDEAQVGGPWKDLYFLDPSMTLARWGVFVSSPTSLAVAFMMPLFAARWVRFKVWCPGATQTGSRVTLAGLPDKLSL